MSVTSEATTAWKGSLFEGSGEVTFTSSGIGTFDVNWKARSEGSSSVTTPEEFADAALFFASPWSRAVTGQNLVVDGGLVRD